MRQKALLFDFDGVIADTEGEYSRFWDKRAALRKTQWAKMPSY